VGLPVNSRKGRVDCGERTSGRVKHQFSLSLLALLSARAILAATDVPLTFHVRLDTPLTSYASAAGTVFAATVISPLETGGQLILPQGTVIHGTVRRATAVGLGLIHERATLELDFHEYELTDGKLYPLSARLEFIENAREQVDSRERIKGVLAASSPQGLLRGIWYRPSESFLPHSVIGLTGLGGAIWSRYSLGPMGAAGMLAARYFAFPLPEPEIQLPAGTEMRLLATAIPEGVPTRPATPDLGVDKSLASWLEMYSRVVTKPNCARADDVINLAFVGSAEELQNAFAAAGWVAAEPLTLHTFSEAYKAYSSMSGYSTAPVSTLLYQGEPPAAVFQKSFNTIAKRHHIRIWAAGSFEGKEVWLGAATHDAGVHFKLASMTFTHKIDPATDGERRKVVMDLSFAACSERISFLGRSTEPESIATPGIETDGRLAVIRLRPCAASSVDDGSLQREWTFAPPGSRGKRAARRFILETRQYFLRDNMYYWAYRATRLGIASAFRGTSTAK
jgi:hypothetical protein